MENILSLKNGFVATSKMKVNMPLPPEGNFVRKFLASPIFMHYNRLILLVLLTNAYYLYQNPIQLISIDQLSLVVAINFTIALVVRTHQVVNLFFKIATSAPTHWPLSIRRTLAKVYHFGGLHVGGAIAGTIWFLILTIKLTLNTAQLPISNATLAISYFTAALMLVICIIAIPKLRAAYHDLFERTTRFGGWILLILFWIQSALINNDLGSSVVDSNTFPLLLILTFNALLPWLRLKKVPVNIQRPSGHVALAKFNYGVTPFAGSSTAISRNPLTEWHSFANVPSPTGPGFRLTISRAGDWTGSFIDDLPSHVWVKGIPTAGVANIEKLFKKVIYIATGSGIGPCLPHLLAQEVPAKLVWATRNPRATYGDDLVDEILAVQPDALIWNTSEKGKPDMVALAYHAYKKYDAEAVICISNKKLTWQVVYGMESRGIPAYGAIWDS